MLKALVFLKTNKDTEIMIKEMIKVKAAAMENCGDWPVVIL